MNTILTIVISFFAASAISARAADVKTNWDNNCAQCHGRDGRADTKMGRQLSGSH